VDPCFLGGPGLCFGEAALQATARREAESTIVRVFKGHKKTVADLAFDAHGRLASTGIDGTVRLWDLAAGQCRHVLAADKRYVFGLRVRFSPDGQRVAATSGLHVRVWDVDSGAEVGLFPKGCAPAQPMVWTPGFGEADGADTGDSTQPHPWRDEVREVAFSPDGRLLTAGRGPYWRQLRTWDVESGTQLHAAPLPGYLYRMALGADGAWLAAIVRFAVCRVDVASLESTELAPFPAADDIVQVLSLSPDGRVLAFGAGRDLTIYDVQGRHTITMLRLPSKHFQQAVFTPDGRWLLAVSNEATVRCWNVASWQAGPTYAWEIGPLKCVAVAPDGLSAAAGSDKGLIVVWDLDA
jgi:WD40 repeat protein